MSRDDYQIEIEIKGYNNRYLEIASYINSSLSSYEGYITSQVKKVARRGKIELSVKLKVFESEAQVHLDEALFRQYLAAFRRAEEISSLHFDVDASALLYLAAFRRAEEISSLHFDVDASALLRIEDLFSTSCQKNAEVYKDALDEALEGALNDFSLSRSREGEETKKDLYRLGRSFEEANDRIGRSVLEYEDYFRKLLIEKYEELDLSSRYDETKLLQEIGALLVKYSINEEQNRLKTHIKEYFKLLESSEPVGKKLDFLCQEMNREVNTTASKSQNVSITLETVQMKDDLENIREQIRNIE